MILPSPPLAGESWSGGCHAHCRCRLPPPWPPPPPAGGGEGGGGGCHAHCRCRLPPPWPSPASAGEGTATARQSKLLANPLSCVGPVPVRNRPASGDAMLRISRDLF